MRKAKVFRNSTLVGTLTEKDDKTYSFDYEDNYFENEQFPPVSLTLPKTKRIYLSAHLFPFFFNMVAEGVNRKLQSKQLQISENDYFGLLMATSSIDSIGAIVLKEIK